MQNKASSTKVCIIGGGPAGLMAAHVLAKAGIEIHIYDQKASVGRKFLIAGEGGLNLSNANPLDYFAAQYLPKPNRFSKYLSAFSPEDTRHFFQSIGIETYVGSSGKIFPTKEHQPSHVLKAWIKKLKALNVQFHTKHKWVSFKEDALLFEDQHSNDIIVNADAYLFAMGGASWPETGSDSLWIKQFEKEGLKCHPPQVSNCGFHTSFSEAFIEKHKNTSIKNCSLNYKGITIKGECNIRTYGLEGIPVYGLSSALRDAIIQDKKATAKLDLKPSWTKEKLFQKIQEKKENTSISEHLYRHIKLSKNAIALLRELLSKKTFTDDSLLATNIKSLSICFHDMRPMSEAISSAGGLCFSELDEQLMLVNKPAYFAAGEMLNWEVRTGGYLLQGCFSTGYIAGKGILNYLSNT